MVLQSTIDTINYVKDIDFDFNMKLLILGVMLIYSVVLLALSFNFGNDKAWMVLTKYIGMRGMTVPYICFFPFALMLLFRGASIEAILQILLVYYSFIFVATVLVFYVFGLEWLLGFFGIDNLGSILTTNISNKRLNGRL